MKGYCEVSDVEAYMGVTLDAIQQALCEIAIGTAESQIDKATRHAWLETGPKTLTLNNPQEPYLRIPGPIASLTSLTVVFNPLSCAAPWALDSSYQYSVQNLADGVIYSPYTWGVYSVVVVYEPDPDVPVPDEVRMATMVMASDMLRLSPALLDGADPSVIQRYVVGGELEVEFRKNIETGTGSIPARALAYLDNWIKNYVVV